MGTDPAGFREDDVISFNRYAYASNNPYGNLDPDGNIPIPVLVFGAYKLASLGYDAYSTYRTLSSADATTTDKALAVGGMVVGAVDPTGASRVVRQQRNVARGAAKSRNQPPAPLREAEGRPHTIVERPGREGQYTTHFGDGTWKQYRGSGQDHGGIPRPNIKEAGTNMTPDGRVFIDRGRVRPARPDEIPRTRQ